MAATSGRPWEAASTRPAQLPSISTLTNALPGGAVPGAQPSPSYRNSSIRDRDSSIYTAQSQSARSSTYSNGTSGHLSLSNITSTHTSPNRVSASSQYGATSHSTDYPPTPSSMGPQSSPGFASSHQSQGLPSINQQYDAPRPSSDFPPQGSRRSSIGSQMNNGMTNLQLNGASSPYGSTNASQTSIALGLQQQRGITNMSNGIRNSRSSGQTPMSPLGPNAGEHRTYYPRTAPIIMANPDREVYNANQPTTGQPYAFPDPDMDRSSGSGDEPRSTGAMFSRRDSGHTSITSSIVTSDSRLPPGQHRLDEDMPGTHHHSLQHRQVSSLVGDPESPDGVSPYSRTPALRVSHKLAERKRRSEMKDLFEALRLQIPSHQGAKSSKWEILTKASDYIKQLEGAVQHGQHAEKQLHRASHDLESTRREHDRLIAENQRMAQEIQRYQQPQPMYQPPPPPPQYGAPPVHILSDPSRSLPPLTNGVPAASTMQGVQYSDDRR